MSNLKTFLFSAIPFTVFGFFNGYSSPFSDSDRSMMLILSAAAITVLAVTVLLQKILDDRNYFPVTVLIAVAAVAGAVISIPPNQYAAEISSFGIRSALIKHPLYLLFASLFAMAVIPALAGKPFTFYFAKKSTPEAFWNTELFLRINLIINNIWAAIFALCFILQIPDSAMFNYGVPLLLKLGVGLPAVKFLPDYLQKKFMTGPSAAVKSSIKSAYEAVSNMPLAFNKSTAAGLSIVYQFKIHGSETFDGYIEIRDGECLYHDGIHSSPDLTINSPADIYLKIATGELRGDNAFMTGLYKLEGDLSLAMKLNTLFTREENKSSVKTTGVKSPAEHDISVKSHYTMKPGEVKRILVLQGSPRISGTSKTVMLTDAFIKGCRDAGAEVEIINLREKRINHCTGCYTCWTKTPGVCAFRDDAAEIISKEKQADIVVYAWPLYHFGINSLLKKYIERTLPSLHPHLVVNENGETSHPMRDGFQKIKHAVLISVCGFPEISHFGAASMNFHYIANSGGENGMRIVAEIYRPGSEILGNPFMKEESDRVLDLARIAGSELVSKGSISSGIIDQIAAVNIDRDMFREMANTSWDNCIREGKTLPELQHELSRGTEK